MIRRSLGALLAATVLVSMAVGTVSRPPQATVVYRLTLTGDQEATPTCAPPTVCGDPDAVGQMILIVNPNTDTVCFLTRWQDVDGTVVAAHIHNGVAGCQPAWWCRCLLAHSPARTRCADVSTALAGPMTSMQPGGLLREHPQRAELRPGCHPRAARLTSSRNVTGRGHLGRGLRVARRIAVP